MAKVKKPGVNLLSTEEKIKEAARNVFLRKGFSGTRTRDIAEEAGINLALLNYYFRSKQKLFDAVMKEKIQALISTIIPVLMDPSTTLEEKIKLVVSNYLKVLAKNNDLPLFVLNELQKNNVSFVSSLPVGKALLQTPFIRQLKQQKPNVDPIHFLVSLIGFIIFPFVAKSILTQSGMINEKQFQVLIQERELLIPLWMEALLKE